LRQLHELFMPIASKKGLLLEIDTNLIAPDVLKGDAKRLHQILANLVGNSIKFTDTGRIVVRHRKRIEADGSIRVAFEIEDTGIGITEGALNRLFKEFEQEEISTSGTYGGSGLGLSICKRLAEAMGGTIGVESRKGQGSRFFFEVAFQEG